MAEEILDLRRLGIALEAKSRGEAPDLSDAQFYSLELLHRHGLLTVGQLQRRIGVLPAQMSRILRSLERGGEEPLIQCAINPTDKRKVDVQLTDAGRDAHDHYRRTKLAHMASVLGQLPRDELETFFSILRSIKDLLTKSRLQRDETIDS
jgi:DNA-binding MarR family transcriptional regulator